MQRCQVYTVLGLILWGVMPSSAGGDGKKIYMRRCMVCHQESGAGLIGVYPSLTTSPYVRGEPIALIRQVLYGPEPAPSGSYHANVPPQGALNDAEAAAVLTYVRQVYGQMKDSINPRLVGKARRARMESARGR